jgi:hypothetical protein
MRFCCSGLGLGRSAPIRTGDPKTAVKHLDCAPACHHHPLESSRRAPARSLYNFNSLRVPQSGLRCKSLPSLPRRDPLQPSDPNKAPFQPQPAGPVEAGGEVENRASMLDFALFPMPDQMLNDQQPRRFR